MTCSQAGKFKYAMKLEKDVLEKTNRILGEEHPSTLTLMTIFLRSSQAQDILVKQRNRDSACWTQG